MSIMDGFWFWVGKELAQLALALGALAFFAAVAFVWAVVATMRNARRNK